MRCLSILVLAAALAGGTDPAAAGAQTAFPADPRSAQADGPPPALRADRATAPPVIDGRITEEAWADAEVARGFTQLQPNPGRAATEAIEVRVLYDDDAIYVAARLFDRAPDSVVAQLGRRDDEVYSDWFYVALDSYFDRRTAFAFGLNPRGVKMDLLLHDDTDEDVSWDAVWEGAAQRDAAGWAAEFRIPLSQLRFSAAGDGVEQRWGVNFLRRIARRDEESFWAPTLPDQDRLVSAFGELRGLRGLRPPRRLEIMPYALTRATAAPGEAGDPFHRGVEPFAGAGLDLKAGITSNLTLTATVNPDFGQVEADPSVVNLTAFETFFPEKRPFFLEGVDIFRFGIGIGDGDLGNESLFYTRRIGRARQGDLDGDFVDAPEATTILAAAKLSGKTAGGWSIGVLDAVTASERGRFVRDGEEGRATVEPLTNYGVVRVIKDFREGRTGLGGIFTATHRSLPESGELDWLRRAAYTGGFDLRHRFGGDAFELTASLVGSHVTGTPEAIDEVQTAPVRYFQRPDADHVDYDPTRTSLSGYAAKADVFKLQGDWRFAVFGLALSPGFEANDLGFQGSGDFLFTGYWASYQRNEPSGILRRWNIGTNGWTGVTYGGENVALGGNVNGSFRLQSFWGGAAGVNWNPSTLSPAMLRGGPAFRRPAGWSGWSHVYSDSRKPLGVSLDLDVSTEVGTGGGGFGIGPGLSVRPSGSAELFLGPSYSRRRSAIQYVATGTALGQERWLLGQIDQTTVAMTARVSYTFSPTLSLQLYAQPFISAGDYSRFKLVADPRARAFADRVDPLGPDRIRFRSDPDGRVYLLDLDRDGVADWEIDDPSFNFRQLRSNLVLRWEYRPGSTLYVVWSQGRTDRASDGRFRFADDVDALWSARGTNVLMVKASYWLGA